ncbi:hypothetical protein [Streptomyces griseosporeus]|uniref:hypothetical protein n=1 Tax=Streptomyces griseosporeus TaxID=1910 RepID=UPI0019C4FBF0|nr:hypothetical protein [Streptomyces griseosporeus]GHF63276.1 hypothetical protein GCM10018783_35680 [Streptomyces griseosporeus]
MGEPGYAPGAAGPGEPGCAPGACGPGERGYAPSASGLSEPGHAPGASGLSEPGQAPDASDLDEPGYAPGAGTQSPAPGAGTQPRASGAPGSAGAPGADRKPPAPRRGGADPVKALMHRHRDLCERAVDPLEIAAGLEAHGVTDRTAARFRHRDVFSLAEEMYARVPRGGDTDAPETTVPEAARPRADWLLLALLPGALTAATLAGLHLTHGRTRLLVAAAGLLAVALGVRAALTRGPLSGTRRTPAPARPSGSRTWTWWLLAYAALGDALLRAAVHGGPDGLPDGTPHGPWPLATAPTLALALSCVPAALAAHLLTEGARRRLTASRGLTEFAAAVRPLLWSAFALYLGCLTALLAVCAALLGERAGYAQGLTLGALLLLARFLHVHGFTHAPAVVLTAAAAAEAAATATVFAGRLPGCGLLAVPVEALVDTWGPGSVPALVCGAGALTLLVHASRTLTRASAHVRTGAPK